MYISDNYKMWRLVKNATEGQEAGEEKLLLGDVAKNATEAVANNLTEEMWKLVGGGQVNGSAELGVVGYNGSDPNDDTSNLVYGNEIGM